VHDIDPAFEYVPAMHSVHTADPMVSENEPAAHWVQLPLVPIVPAAQSQAVCPAWELSPAGQSAQLDAPAFAANVPAAHGVQVGEFGASEYVPAEHWAQTVSWVPLHAVATRLPGSQVVHGTQSPASRK